MPQSDGVETSQKLGKHIKTYSTAKFVSFNSGIVPVRWLKGRALKQTIWRVSERFLAEKLKLGINLDHKALQARSDSYSSWSIRKLLNEEGIVPVMFRLIIMLYQGHSLKLGQCYLVKS